MRFPTSFRRRVGDPSDHVPQEWLQQGYTHLAGSRQVAQYLVPQLGTDELPLPGKPLQRRDNIHEVKFAAAGGFVFPSQSSRVVVGYRGPDGVPPLLADLFVFDETSTSWFTIPSPTGGVLTPGTLAYFDPPCILAEDLEVSGNIVHMVDSLEVLLIPWSMAKCALPVSVYTFVLGTVGNRG